MDQSVANQLMATVEAATQQAEALASSTSDPTIRGGAVKAVATLRRAVNAWETKQLDSVNQGLHPDAWWTDYGKSLLEQAGRYARDNGQFYQQWSHALEVAGSTLQSVGQVVQSRIREWRMAVDGYKQQLAAFDEQELTSEQLAASLLDVRAGLSSELQDLLYGSTAHEAASQLSALHEAVALADRMVSALEQGAAAEFNNGDIVLASEQNVSLPGLQGTRLGSPLYVAGAVVAGLVGLLAICGVLVTWLLSYYQHLAQVTQQEGVERNMERGERLISEYQQTVANPRATQQEKAAALVKLKLAGDSGDIAKFLAKQSPPDPFGGLSKTLQALEEVLVAGLKVGAVAAAGYLVWSNREAIKAWLQWLASKLRARNPRRGRRRIRRLTA